jgi:hypothetical protein
MSPTMKALGIDRLSGASEQLGADHMTRDPTTDGQGGTQRRSTMTIIRILLAIGGIAALVEPIRASGSSAYSQGQVQGRAIIALVLLVAAIPWGRPPKSAKEEAGEL